MNRKKNEQYSGGQKRKKKKKIHIIHKAELNPRVISKYKLYVR